MISRLAAGSTVALVAATLSACAPTGAHAPQGPRPITPADGPRGTVHVDYRGGAYTRQIETRFRLDKSGYVLVAHLGGDGQIEVLYPKSPRAVGWVSAGKTIFLKARSAAYDVSPHLYSVASAPYRSFSAQTDSYDGLGHGYVFMIMSRRPINYAAIAAGEGFELLEIEGYASAHDPRFAVRNLADDLATGPYTLKFARDPSGSAYARATGCPSFFGMMGFGAANNPPLMDMGYSYFTYPGAALLNGIAFARLYGMQSCRGSQFYVSTRRFFSYEGTTVGTPVTGTPRGPLTPRLQRPTRRTLEDRDRTPLISGRSAIDRRGPSRSAFDGGRRAIRPTFGEPDRPRATEIHRPTSTEIWRPERATRPMDTPRLTTPPAPPPTTTTSTSGGTETKAERPTPRP